MNWRRIIEKLAGSTESPRRTAAAFAFGTFLSFSPFVGFQTISGLGLAFLLRLNRLAVFIGLNMNLPWIMVPWYTFTTILGGWILGRPVVGDFSGRLSTLLTLPFYELVFWQQAYDLVAPFFWSYMVGSTLCAIPVGLAAYAITAKVLRRYKTQVAE